MQTITRRPRGRPKAELVVSVEQRVALERWARRPKTAQALALRARIVLGCAAGLSNGAVAAELGVHPATVGKWRRRFVERAARTGCSTSRGRGRRARSPTRTVEGVDRRTLESRRRTRRTGRRARWPPRRAVADARSAGSGAPSALQPHRLETFKLSTDPLFVEKVRDVVGLYLDPPERAMVLCVDEKSQIQALDRTQPLLPMLPGTPARRSPRLRAPRHDHAVRRARHRHRQVIGSSCIARHRAASSASSSTRSTQTVPADARRPPRPRQLRHPQDARDPSAGCFATPASSSTSSPRAAPGSTSSSAGSPS